MHNSEGNELPLLCGIRPLMEAIEAGKNFDKIFLKKGERSDSFRELMQMIKEHDLFFQIVPEEKLNRLIRKNHQGVVAFLTHVEYQRIEQVLPAIYESGKEPLIVLLDRITDVRNFGAIALSAECMGAHALVIPVRGMAPASGDAIKASAGALMRIPVCRESHLKESIQLMKDSGLKIISCTEKGEDSLFETDLSGPICLIMGSEEDGVSGEYLKRSDHSCFIPMAGQTSSLNVSVASGIFLAEVCRNR